MVRMLACCALVAMLGCSNNDPPPDPLGACAKGQKAYERIEAAVTMIAGYAPDIPVDSFCMKLRIATKLDEVAVDCMTKGVVRTQQALKDKLAEGRAALARTCSK